MKLVKVGAAVLNQTPLAWDQNKENVLSAIELGRQEGVSILCLPELCVTGYGCEDLFHSPGFQEMAWQVLLEILPATKGMVVSLSLPIFYQNALFNSACLAVDGQITGFVTKRYLASDGIHYEPRWFKPWPEDVSGSISVGGKDVPIGDIMFDCGGVKIGFEICEDAWAAQRPGGKLSRRGVDIILNPSASHFAFDKIDIRKRFVEEGSRAFGVTYVYSNLVGNEAGRALYDGGALIASGGNLLAVGSRFSYADVSLTTAVVDVELSRMKRTRPVSFNPIIDAASGHTAVSEFDYPDIEPIHHKVVLEEWEKSKRRKEEEFTRAVALGLFDYLRKSRCRGYTVSLSGGADSTTVCCLVALMTKLGVAELGASAFAKKLSYIPGFSDLTTWQEMVEKLLVCVYQGTVNSSDTTRNAAKEVAESINAKFYQWDVDDEVNGYKSLVTKAIGRELSWDKDDLALQNIQARVRAPGVWLLANINNSLLLSTSNRSEAAVGYATMDGDTCGGLSPIAGIDKNFLRQWLRWLEVEGPIGSGSIPGVRCVNIQQPTAELKPPGEKQTDESDLMPYDLLDAIERAAIRDKKTPVTCFRIMKTRFAKYGEKQLASWVIRFFKLWSRNQWKRERYAPSFHLDDENLDPKTWCRFPILSGGFSRELSELEKLVNK